MTFKGELNPKIKFVLFERTLKITVPGELARMASKWRILDKRTSFTRVGLLVNLYPVMWGKNNYSCKTKSVWPVVVEHCMACCCWTYLEEFVNFCYYVSKLFPLYTVYICEIILSISYFATTLLLSEVFFVFPLLSIWRTRCPS